MFHLPRRWLLCLPLLGLLAALAAAQQPALQAINPAQARADGTVHGLDGPAFAIASNEDAGLIAVACEEGTIRIWAKDVLMGVRAGESTPNVLKGHAGPVTSLAWNGSFLASGGVDRKILLWDVGDQRILYTFEGGGVVRTLAAAPDGKLLASAGDDPAIKLWNPETGKLERSLPGQTDWVCALAFSSDGKWLASGGFDGTVRLWEVASGKKLFDIPARSTPAAKMEPPPVSPVHALAFSPDHKTLAIGCADGLIHLANTADGKITRSLSGHTSTVTGLAFHGSGTVLASSSRDNSVRLWNPANGQALKTLDGHTAWVQGLAFVAQGTRLASVGADRAVWFWDLGGKK